MIYFTLLKQLPRKLIKFSISITSVVEKTKLTEAITALRAIGGSGVVVSPTLFIFEEEPEQYKKLLRKLEGAD